MIAVVIIFNVLCIIGHIILLHKWEQIHRSAKADGSLTFTLHKKYKFWQTWSVCFILFSSLIIILNVAKYCHV